MNHFFGSCPFLSLCPLLDVALGVGNLSPCHPSEYAALGMGLRFAKPPDVVGSAGGGGACKDKVRPFVREKVAE